MIEEIKEVEIIDEVKVEEKPEVTIESLDTLDPIEKEMAIKNNFVKEEKVEKKEDVKSEQKKAEEKNNQTFEDTEKDEKNLLKNFNKNEQGLYWKWKHDKELRQKAQREYEHSTIREKALNNELDKIKKDASITVDKLNKINNLLTGNPEDITIEAIQEILGSKQEEKVDDDNKPLTKKDLEELSKKRTEEQNEQQKRQEFVQSRAAAAEEYGKTKYENYDNIIECAKQVLDGEVEVPEYVDIKDLSKKFVEKLTNKDVDIEKVAQFVYSVAKINPKFGEVKPESKETKEEVKEVRKETNENIERILKNANKSQSSAAISGGNGRRMVSLEDLTIDDVAKMSTEQYSKLPDHIRRKFLYKFI